MVFNESLYPNTNNGCENFKSDMIHFYFPHFLENTNAQLES